MRRDCVSKISYMWSIAVTNVTYKHDLQALFECHLALVSAQDLGFAGHSETFTTFRVSNDNPGAANVLQLVRTHLTGESAILGVVATVLRADFNVVSEHGQNHGNVNVRNAQNHIDIGGDVTSTVEDVDSFHIFIVQAVAFPVSSNQITTRSYDCVF